NSNNGAVNANLEGYAYNALWSTVKASCKVLTEDNYDEIYAAAKAAAAVNGGTIPDTLPVAPENLVTIAIESGDDGGDPTDPGDGDGDGEDPTDPGDGDGEDPSDNQDK